MLGYIVAYEGVLGKNKDYHDNGQGLDQLQQNRAIYISDLAADVQASKLAGGRLIRAFVDRVGTEYLAKKDPTPLIFEARDKTSYQIVQKHLKKLGEEYNYNFTAEEIEQYDSGDDTMHVMKLTPHSLQI